MPDDARPSVLVIMGVSGCGKSSFGRALAVRLGWPFQEGDDLHPPANVAKMSAGCPLDDDDRAPWLDAVRRWAADRLSAGVSGVITCSALKRDYRDRLRAAGAGLRFVYLEGGPELIASRLAARPGHFMPASLLASQFAALEPPVTEADVAPIAINLPLARQVDIAIAMMGRV